ncbi:MAG: DUF262 domain-containing protein [Erysipelotrichales bacterium]|nr:DUF262 domain-containing protein [Erysipelotrichales bacterium]
MRKRLDFTTSSSTIGSLWVDYTDKYLNLQPSYQRNYVWSDSFKNKLIYSLIKNYPIGSITIRKLSESQKKNGFISEVVDGQQRLTTIFAFLDNKFIIGGEDAINILEEVADYYSETELKQKKNKQKILDKIKNGTKKIDICYADLPERVQIQINNYNMAVSTINQAEDVEVAEYFRFVQNQERLRAGEIINAFVECPLDDILEKKCNVHQLEKVLSIDNSRKEINKAFYGIIGLLVGKLNLGCTDDEIINFASHINSENIDSEIQFYSLLIATQLGHIANKCPDGCVKTNKRMLKFIMLLSGLEKENYNDNTLQKLLGLEKLNNNISAFNSAKKDEITKTFGESFDKDDLENHRLIALISKGGHNKNRVVERIELLKEMLIKYYY